MGYPHQCTGKNGADWYFQTPAVLLQAFDNFAPMVYLCDDCWTAWQNAVAIGIVFPAF